MKSKNARREYRQDITTKQLNFANEYDINGGNAAAAYRCHYDADKMSANAIYREASLLLLNRNVSQRIDDLRAEHGEKYNISREFLTTKLIKALVIAEAKMHEDSMRRTTMDIAKLHGLIVDISDVNMNNNYTVMKDVTLEGNKLTFDVGSKPIDDSKFTSSEPLTSTAPTIIDLSPDNARHDAEDLM